RRSAAGGTWRQLRHVSLRDVHRGRLPPAGRVLHERRLAEPDHAPDERIAEHLEQRQRTEAPTWLRRRRDRGALPAANLHHERHWRRIRGRCPGEGRRLIMTTKSIAAGIVAICFAAGFAPRLHAQSMSTYTRAKRAASNAVAATNEHTKREQMLDDGKGTAAGKAATTKA